jgi:hypothetical protein
MGSGARRGRGGSRRRKTSKPNPHEIWLTADGIGENRQERHLLIYRRGKSYNILDEWGARHLPERRHELATEENVRSELEEHFKISNLRLTYPVLEHLRKMETLRGN